MGQGALCGYLPCPGYCLTCAALTLAFLPFGCFQVGHQPAAGETFATLDQSGQPGAGLALRLGHDPKLDHRVLHQIEYRSWASHCNGRGINGIDNPVDRRFVIIEMGFVCHSSDDTKPPFLHSAQKIAQRFHVKQIRRSMQWISQGAGFA